ncbi:hypothetical protein EON63_25125 [archaeon]|nr:MAG: hypothetical protein EON63_25125 [archaeon]
MVENCYLPDAGASTLTVSGCSAEGGDCNGLTATLYSVLPDDRSGRYTDYWERNPDTSDSCGGDSPCYYNTHILPSPLDAGYYLLSLNPGEATDPEVYSTFVATYTC